MSEVRLRIGHAPSAHPVVGVRRQLRAWRIRRKRHRARFGQRSSSQPGGGKAGQRLRPWNVYGAGLTAGGKALQSCRRSLGFCRALLPVPALHYPGRCRRLSRGPPLHHRRILRRSGRVFLDLRAADALVADSLFRCSCSAAPRLRLGELCRRPGVLGSSGISDSRHRQHSLCVGLRLGAPVVRPGAGAGGCGERQGDAPGHPPYISHRVAAQPASLLGVLADLHSGGDRHGNRPAHLGPSAGTRSACNVRPAGSDPAGADFRAPVAEGVYHNVVQDESGARSCCTTADL